METKLDKAREQINIADKVMADAFEKRMEASKSVAEYKYENGLDIFDPKREEKVINNNLSYIKNPQFREYYTLFIKNNMKLSKEYQKKVIAELDSKTDGSGVCIPICHSSGKYDVIIKRGAIHSASEYFDLNRKIMVITDSGVPKEYSEKILSQSKDSVIFTIESGEENKSIENVKRICECMLENKFTRKDAVIAVGGGIVGDIAGLCASLFERGIDFYNVPTTLLSQVDSSVGGKVAVNLGKIKNSIGAFKNPDGVIIDPELLSTLPDRQIRNGLAEALKMALIFDKELFGLFENGNVSDNLEFIIKRSIELKKEIVEKDEKESGLRRTLNFGHTIGHGIESTLNGRLFHGECVALGMIPMVSDKIRPKLISALEKLGLPTKTQANKNEIIRKALNDKKMYDGVIKSVFCEEIGEYSFKDITKDELSERIDMIL